MTKQYRLLKDLPFVKAGSISRMRDNDDTDKNDEFYFCFDRESGFAGNRFFDEKEIPKLIDFGWIEEVKEEGVKTSLFTCIALSLPFSEDITDKAVEKLVSDILNKFNVTKK